MTIEEHSKIIATLQTVVPIENQDLLVNLGNDYQKTAEELESERQNLETLNKQNEDYKKVNNSLWLQVSNTTEKTKLENNGAHDVSNNSETVKALSYAELAEKWGSK